MYRRNPAIAGFFFIDLWIAFLSRDDLNRPGASSDQLGYHADMGVHQRDKETMIRYEGNIHLHRGWSSPAQDNVFR